MNDNEKLIEEAKNLIEQADSFRAQVGNGANPTSLIGLWLRTADSLKDVLAVFEKAHTPTDDEREGLEDALKYLDALNTDRQILYDDYLNLHALVSSASHRREEREQDTEVLGEWFTSSYGVAVAAVAPMTDRGPSVLVDGRVISPNDVAALVEFKTQGEPSDAQVRAALRVFFDGNPDFMSEPSNIEDMRAALRAAGRTR